MVLMVDLLKYASYGGVACVIAGSAYQAQLNLKLKNAQYYKEAMKILNEHKASDLLLGKPITSGYIDVFSGKNCANSMKADLFIPLKGSKAKGELFFNAVKSENDWLVKRVELEVKDDLGGKVLLYDVGMDSDTYNTSEATT